MLVWLGGVAVGRRIRDREVASSISSCSDARCNSGQVVHTRVPLFTKQYKLVPASAGGKVHHRSGVGYAAGSHSADLTVAGQPAPLQHRTCCSRCTYSGLGVTFCHVIPLYKLAKLYLFTCFVLITNGLYILILHCFTELQHFSSMTVSNSLA